MHLFVSLLNTNLVSWYIPCSRIHTHPYPLYTATLHYCNANIWNKKGAMFPVVIVSYMYVNFKKIRECMQCLRCRSMEPGLTKRKGIKILSIMMCSSVYQKHNDIIGNNSIKETNVIFKTFFHVIWQFINR